MKVKIIRVAAFGTIFSNLVPDSIHEVVKPPKDYAKKYPNSLDSVWVNGSDGNPVRVFTSGRGKEAFILSE